MSAFMVNTNVMAKVLTAILLNLDQFDGESTYRVKLLAAPTDAQKEAGTKRNCSRPPPMRKKKPVQRLAESSFS